MGPIEVHVLEMIRFARVQAQTGSAPKKKPPGPVQQKKRGDLAPLTLKTNQDTTIELNEDSGPAGDPIEIYKAGDDLRTRNGNISTSRTRSYDIYRRTLSHNVRA